MSWERTLAYAWVLSFSFLVVSDNDLMPRAHADCNEICKEVKCYYLPAVNTYYAYLAKVGHSSILALTETEGELQPEFDLTTPRYKDCPPEALECSAAGLAQVDLASCPGDPASDCVASGDEQRHWCDPDAE